MDETNNYNEKTILNSYQLPTRTKAKSLRSDPRKLQERKGNAVRGGGGTTSNNIMFNNFRIPPLIIAIDGDGDYSDEDRVYDSDDNLVRLPDQIHKFVLTGCKSIFSLEVPENLREIKYRAFEECYYLRNVAFPPETVFSNYTLIEGETADLHELFGLQSEIIRRLQHAASI